MSTAPDFAPFDLKNEAALTETSASVSVAPLTAADAWAAEYTAIAADAAALPKPLDSRIGIMDRVSAPLGVYAAQLDKQGHRLNAGLTPIDADLDPIETALYRLRGVVALRAGVRVVGNVPALDEMIAEQLTKDQQRLHRAAITVLEARAVRRRSANAKK